MLTKAIGGVVIIIIGTITIFKQIVETISFALQLLFSLTLYYEHKSPKSSL